MSLSSFLVPVDKLCQKPYSELLAYPNPSLREVERRIAELKKLGIVGCYFSGNVKIGSMSVIGKGHVGIAILASTSSHNPEESLVALKIRRLDASRDQMENEKILLKLANKIGVGPRIVSSSRNFIAMQYLDGSNIFDWISSLKGPGSAVRLRTVLYKILYDCYMLDKIKLDHGELSYIHKHAIVIDKNRRNDNESVVLLDFESASVNRSVSNVTSATQCIFIGTGMSKLVKRIITVPQKEKVIDALRQYKQDKSYENFSNLVSVLGLDRNSTKNKSNKSGSKKRSSLTYTSKQKPQQL